MHIWKGSVIESIDFIILKRSWHGIIWSTSVSNKKEWSDENRSYPKGSNPFADIPKWPNIPKKPVISTHGR